MEISYEFDLRVADYSDGASFAVGAGISLCYYMTPSNIPYTVRLYKSTDGGAWEGIGQWTDTGGGDCLPSTVGAPAGKRTYLAQAIVGGEIVGEDTAWINVTSGSSGGNPPGGSCDRAPSQPSVLAQAGNAITVRVSDTGGGGCNVTWELNSFGGQFLGSGSFSGDTAVITVPSTACGAYYFIGAKNQRGGSAYTLWYRC